MAANTDHQPNIEHVRDLLSPYLDGEVTDEERALVEQAMVTSPELRHELESLRQTVELVASLPQISAPRPFTLSEADVQAVSPAPRKFFGLPAWASGLAMLAAVLVCVLAAGGLFWQIQFTGSRMPAAEIAQFAAEAPAEEAPVEEAREEEAAAPAEEKLEGSVEVENGAVQTVEVEKEVIVEKEVEAAAPLPEPTMTEEMGKAAAPAEKTADDMVVAGGADTVSEADVDRGAAAEDSTARSGVALTATPAPMPTPTVAALIAPATELAEKEGQVPPSAGGEVPVTQPEQEAQIEKESPPATTATSTPTVFPSPTPVTRLTFVPSATPTLRASETILVAEEASPRVRPLLGGAVILVVGLLVAIGLIGWAIIRGRKKS